MNDLTIYNQNAPLMDTGDSLLYVGHQFISEVIQWWVKSWLLGKGEKDRLVANHGNLVLRLREFEGKTDRRWVLDARASGAYPVLLSDYLSTYDGSCFWFPLKDQYGPMRTEIGCKAMELAGKPYDFAGLIKNAVGRVSVNMREVFCTESIFISYRDGGHIVAGDKVPRPDQLPFLAGSDGLTIFKEPIKLL